MKKIIEGSAYVLGNNVDTDQIIPADKLMYSLSDPEEKKFYGQFALSGVPEAQAGLPKGQVSFVNEGEFSSPYKIIVGGNNFGCGSSREHAPACLEIAGVQAVVAESFARIFYRNSIDGGFFIPFETEASVYQEIETGDALRIDVEKGTLENKTKNKTYNLKPLGDVADIIEAGDIFQYARKAGLIKT
jgi:3-isopropylmalate/(R)-2-methylmalate dehydratase small subunit